MAEMGIAFFGKSPDEAFPNRCDMLYLDDEGNEKWVTLYSEREVPKDIESLAKEVVSVDDVYALVILL